MIAGCGWLGPPCSTWNAAFSARTERANREISVFWRMPTVYLFLRRTRLLWLPRPRWLAASSPGNGVVTALRMCRFLSISADDCLSQSSKFRRLPMMPSLATLFESTSPRVPVRVLSLSRHAYPSRCVNHSIPKISPKSANAFLSICVGQPPRQRGQSGAHDQRSARSRRSQGSQGGCEGHAGVSNPSKTRLSLCWREYLFVCVCVRGGGVPYLYCKRGKIRGFAKRGKGPENALFGSCSSFGASNPSV